MADIERLGVRIEVDQSGASSAIVSFTNQFRSATASITRDLTTIRTGSAAASAATAQSLTNISVAINGVGQAAQRNRGLVQGFIGGLAGGAVVALAAQVRGLGRELLQASDSFALIQAKMRLATDGYGSFDRAMNDVVGISNETRTRLSDTATLYGKVAAQAKQMGIGQDKVRAVVTNFNKALKISGATANEASSAILQFSQSLASGKLQGDEFRSLGENAPRFMNLLADSLNVPRGALKKLASEGEITSDKLVKALSDPKFVAKLEKEFGTIPVTFGDMATAGLNMVTRLTGAFANGFGVSDSLAVLLAKLNQFTGDVAPKFQAFGQQVRDVFTTLQPTLQGIAGVIGPILTTLGSNLGNIARLAVVAAAGFTAFKVATAAGSIATTVGQLVALEKALGAGSTMGALFSISMKGVQGAVRGVTVALAANPLTAWAVAITAAAVALYEFSDKIKISTGGMATLADYGNEILSRIGPMFTALGEIASSVFSAIGQFAADYLGPIGDLWNSVTEGMEFSFSGFVRFFAKSIDFIINAVTVSVSTIASLWANFPAMLQNYVAMAVNGAASLFEKFINGIIGGLNTVSSYLGLNTIEADYVTNGAANSIANTIAQAKVNDEATARSNADGALSNRLNTIEADYVTNSGAANIAQAKVNDEATARANADSALSNRATALEARSSGSGNLLSNTDFPTADGWTITSNLPSTALGRNDGSVFGGDNWRPVGEFTLSIQQSARYGNSANYVEVQSTSFAVNPGDWLQFYAFLSSHRSNGWLSLFFFKSDDTWAGYAGENYAPRIDNGGRIIGNWDQVGLKAVQVPAGASYARMTWRKYDTIAGQNESIAWLLRPYVSYAREGQTEWNPYSPGSSRSSIVAANTRITDEATASSNRDSALGGRISTIEADYVTNGAANSIAQAKVNDEATVRSNADGALSGRISTTEAKLNLDQDSNLYARIRSEEATRASQDSALSSRTSSVEAVAGSSINSLNANPTFSMWPDGQELPTAYTWWGKNGSSATRSTATLGRGGFSADVSNPSGVESGLAVADVYTTPGWYVIEADVWLVSGVWEGSGVTLGGVYNLDFLRDPDVNGAVGEVSYGGVRRFSKLMKFTDTAYRAFHPMNVWAGLSSNRPAKTMRWLRCAIRPASDGEIIAQKANGTAENAQARINDEVTARANADSALATRATTLETSVSSGSNILSNTDFAVSDAGWLYGQETATGAGRDAITGNNWWPHGLHPLVIGQENSNQNRAGYWYQDVYGIEANKTYQASMYAASHRCETSIYIDCYDAAGNNLGTQESPHINYAGNDNYAPLSSWWRHTFNFTTPTGTTRLRFHMMKYGTLPGQGNSYAWFIRPQLVQVRAGMTGAAPYQPGSGDAGLTAANSRISDEATTRSNQDSALSSRISTTEAKLNLDQDSNLYIRIRNEENTRASADSAIAVRATALEASALIGTSAARNDKFAMWRDGNQLPDNWMNWSTEGNWRVDRQAGNAGSPYSVRTLNDYANVECGFYQQVPVYAGKWIVEVTAESDGSGFSGAGITLHGVFNIDFLGDTDTKGYAGDQGNTMRTWNKAFDFDQNFINTIGGTINLHAMHDWTGFGRYRAPKYMKWHRVSLRPAGLGDAEAVRANARISDEASTRASQDSALANRASSLEANIKVEANSLNINPNFKTWGDAGSPPDNWGWWDAAGGIARVGGVNGRPYAMQFNPPANVNSGVVQGGINAAFGSFVIEFTGRANDWQGAGVLVYFLDSNGSLIASRPIPAAATADTSGYTSADGGGGAYTRSWSVYHRTNIDGAIKQVQIYAMANWDGFGERRAKQITFDRVSIRQATASETAAQRVEENNLYARVSSNESAVANLNGKTQAYFSKSVSVPGADAFITAIATNDQGQATSNVAIGGSTVALYNTQDGSAKRAMYLAAGNATFDGMITARSGIRVGDSQWQIAVSPRDYGVNNGTVVNFGYDLGRVPSVTFGPCPIALNSGEVYRAYAADATSTGFRAVCEIVGSPVSANQSTGAGYSVNGSQVFDVGKGTPDASNGQYTFQVSGNVQAYAYNDGGGVNCVHIDAWVADGLQAGDVQEGDIIMILNEDGSYYEDARVQRNFITSANCVRITSESGIQLTLSETTPVTIRDMSVVNVRDVVGHELAVLDENGFRWETITNLEDIGEQPIAHINVNDGTYAAGDVKGKMIFTHNIAYKP